MALNKARGDMYEWVTHTHTHLRGECPHKCGYCYVKDTPAGRQGFYDGRLRLDEKQLHVSYGKGKTIFIDHMNDLFATPVKDEWIMRIVNHCHEFPCNWYVMQSKNPWRMMEFFMPLNCILGTTIESNIQHKCMGQTVPPLERARGIAQIQDYHSNTFVTIEPILDFDLEKFLNLLVLARPSFVNIGADSGGNNLPEPSYDKIMALVDGLKAAGIEVRKKVNLDRLRG